MNNIEILLQIKELDIGLVPREVWFEEDKATVNQGRWSTLTEEEKKVSKRKFRKIFRKACKDLVIDPKKVKRKDRARMVRNFLIKSCKEELGVF